MSGAEQNDAGSREEGEGDDYEEILHLRAKVDRKNEEADSKRLRVIGACRLILRISVSSFSSPTTRTSVAFYSFISCPILTNTIR